MEAKVELIDRVRRDAVGNERRESSSQRDDQSALVNIQPKSLS